MLDGHDKRNKCCVNTCEWIEGSALLVSGHLFCHDFPELGTALRQARRRVRHELRDGRAGIENVTDPVWRVTRCIFSGAALLFRNKAAYKRTCFNLTASGEDTAFTGTITMLAEGPMKIG